MNKLIAFLFLFTIPILGQIKFNNKVVGEDTLTVAVSCFNYPKNEEELSVFLEELFDGLKFRTDSWDNIEYLMALRIYNGVLGFGEDGYSKAGRDLIDFTNQWLYKHHEEQK